MRFLSFPVAFGVLVAASIPTAAQQPIFTTPADTALAGEPVYVLPYASQQVSDRQLRIGLITWVSVGVSANSPTSGRYASTTSQAASFNVARPAGTSGLGGSRPACAL